MLTLLGGVSAAVSALRKYPNRMEAGARRTGVSVGRAGTLSGRRRLSKGDMRIQGTGRSKQQTTNPAPLFPCLSVVPGYISDASQSLYIAFLFMRNPNHGCAPDVPDGRQPPPRLCHCSIHFPRCRNRCWRAWPYGTAHRRTAWSSQRRAWARRDRKSGPAAWFPGWQARCAGCSRPETPVSTASMSFSSSSRQQIFVPT